MIIKHWGFFCVSCKKFNPLSQYSVELVETIGSSVDLGLSPHHCVHCGYVCAYNSGDVAHCTSRDGANPQWPNGVFLKLIYDCPSCGAQEIFSETKRATKSEQEFIGELAHMKKCLNPACPYFAAPHFDLPVSRVERVG